MKIAVGGVLISVVIPPIEAAQATPSINAPPNAR
jgi:hypothetical protein